ATYIHIYDNRSPSIRRILSRSRPQPRPPPFPYTTLFRSMPKAVSIFFDTPRKGQQPRNFTNMKFSISIAVIASEKISAAAPSSRSEEHTSELQSRFDLVCRLLLEKKKDAVAEKGLHNERR